MLRNHLLVALRVLRRSPLYAAINIVGLAVGLASCILMLLYVHQEWTYDAFHRNADQVYRLYRVEHRVRTPLKQSEGTMAPLGPAIEAEVPGVEAVARFVPGDAEVIGQDGALPLRIAYVDPAFLGMLDFGGQPSDLASPDVVLLTESAQRRLGAAAGADLQLDAGSGNRRVLVASVLADPPVTSSLQFDAVAPFKDRPGADQAETNWDSFGNGTLVQLRAGTDPADLEAAMAGIIRANYGETIQGMIDQGWWADREDTFSIRAQPLADAHLSPEIDSFYLEVSNPVYSLILLGIALIVLLIACTNFMALSIGRSVTRAREVGTRKAMGASRSQVAAQFWGEAVLLSLLAVVLGLALADQALPVFNRLADTSLELVYTPMRLLLFGALGVLVGLGAGAYPAGILSALRPSSVLGGGDSGRRGTRFTRGVIVFQFAATIVLIATSMIMYRQLEYVADRDLGFAAQEIAVLPLDASDDRTALELYDQVRVLAAASPAVVSTSPSSSAFGGSWSRTVLVEGGASHVAYTNFIGPSFLETMGMELVAGRNLSASLETDAEHAILVNEALVSALGWEEPLGQSLERWPDVQVVGVVRNFNHLSLHQEVSPMVLHMSPAVSSPRYAMIRFRSDMTTRAVTDLEAAWAAVAPGAPFSLEFLDQRLQRLYESEQRWLEISGYAALLAVLISCLGLFGVATMSVARRRKEIGVRKVFGASLASLAALISRDFALLVVLAFALGAPVAWVVADRWMESFAYRWPINPLILLAAGGVALLVALLTVSFQAVSAARANPTETLRYE